MPKKLYLYNQILSHISDWNFRAITTTNFKKMFVLFRMKILNLYHRYSEIKISSYKNSNIFVLNLWKFYPQVKKILGKSNYSKRFGQFYGNTSKISLNGTFTIKPWRFSLIFDGQIAIFHPWSRELKTRQMILETHCHKISYLIYISVICRFSILFLGIIELMILEQQLYLPYETFSWPWKFITLQ